MVDVECGHIFGIAVTAFNIWRESMIHTGRTGYGALHLFLVFFYMFCEKGLMLFHFVLS